MNSIQKLIAGLALSLPIISSGCKEPTGSIWRNHLPLDNLELRKEFPGIHFFAKGKDHLTPEDVEDYVKVIIDNGDGKLEVHEVEKIKATMDDLESVTKNISDGSLPTNIRITLTGFDTIYKKYLIELARAENEKLEAKEREIKDKLDKHLILKPKP